MGQDSATFRDKGTMGQAQNLAMGWNGLGRENLYFSVKIRDEGWDNHYSFL